MTKTYNFNPNHVCTNPDTVHQETNKKYSAEARIALAPDGQWRYGISVHHLRHPYQRIGSPCSEHGTPYPTATEANQAANQEIHSHIQQFIQPADTPPAQLKLF